MNRLLEPLRGADRNRPTLTDRLALIASGISEAEQLLARGRAQAAKELLGTVLTAVSGMIKDAKP